MVGTSLGNAAVFHVSSLALLQRISLPGSSALRSLSWSRDGQSLLCQNGERLLRVLDSGSLSVLREFQDVVNRIVWSSACLSGHSDYVVASSKSKHHIYIWNRVYGRLVTMLDCPQPSIVQLCWHPVRPLLVAVLVNGQIAIWSKNVSENWAAFAPDFVVLQENVEYEEREDEFDIVSLLPRLTTPLLNGRSQKHGDLDGKCNEEENNDEQVDIVSSHLVDVWSSDEEDSMRYLPAEPLPDPSNVAMAASSRLRKLEQLRKPPPNHAALRKRKLDEMYGDTAEPAHSQTHGREPEEQVVGGDRSHTEVKRERQDNDAIIPEATS